MGGVDRFGIRRIAVGKFIRHSKFAVIEILIENANVRFPLIVIVLVSQLSDN